MSQTQQTTIFWIIFLIIVVVFALLIFPQYGYLAKTIQTSLTRNIAANLTAATAANYKLRKSHPSKGYAVLNCQDIPRIQRNHLPEGYQIVKKEIPADKVVFCTLEGPGTEMQFSAIGIN